MTPFASCACGRAFTAAEWRELHFVGMQDDGDGGVFELRNCECGSTFAPDEEQERCKVQIARTAERYASQMELVR
jgi:hypothetical protein